MSLKSLREVSLEYCHKLTIYSQIMELEGMGKHSLLYQLQLEIVVHVGVVYIIHKSLQHSAIGVKTQPSENRRLEAVTFTV